MRFGAMWALLGTVLAFSTADAHATVYSGSTTFSAPVGTPSLTGPTPDPAQTEEYLHTLSAYYDDRSGSLTIQFSLYDSATWGPSLKDGDGGSGSGGEPLFWPFQFSLGYLGDRQHPASYPGDPTPEVFCDGSGLPGVDQPQLGSPVLSGTIVSTFSDTDNDGDDDGTSTANDADGDGVFAGDTINNVTLEGYSGDLSAPTSFDGTTFTATIQNSAFSGHIWDCLVVNQSIELPLSPPTPPPPIPKLLNPWKGTFSVRPHMIGLSGDGTSFLAGSRQHGRQSRKNPAWPGHIAWSNWTMTQATGSGGNWLDNCRPACANGRYDVHPAQFRAYRPQNGHFTRLWVRVKYSGRWRTHTYKLVHGSGFWYWSW